MRTPDFILIGANKSATTSVHDYLQQHPNVFMITPKGNDLLSRKRYQSLKNAKEYLDQLRDAPTDSKIGEASSIYLHKPGTAEVIHRLFPRVKLFAVLRNPIERAYSAAFFGRVLSKDDVARVAEWIPQSEELLRMGLYYEQVRAYLSIFPRDNFKVLLFDELVRDAQVFLRQIFEFIEVDPAFVPNLKRKHHLGSWRVGNSYSRMLSLAEEQRPEVRLLRSWVPAGLRKRLRSNLISRSTERIPIMSSDLRAKLRDYYREDILKLQDLLGIDCSNWLA